MKKKRLLSLFFILSALIFIISCSKEFENPIDPDIDGSVPPMPTDLRAFGATYNSIELSFSYSYQNALGIIIYRNNKIHDTISLDTTYLDLINIEEESVYFYKVCAYNANGISEFSNVAYDTTLIASGNDKGPIFTVKYLTEQITVKRITVDTLTLNGSVSDPSGVSSFTVSINGGVAVDLDDSLSWNYKFAFKAFTNIMIFEAIDSIGNVSRDTVIIEYDYQNKKPEMSKDIETHKIIVSWQNFTDIDYKSHKFWVSSDISADTNSAILILDSNNPTDSMYEFTHSNDSLRYCFHCAMYDSAGNVLYSRIFAQYLYKRNDRMVEISAGSHLSEFTITYNFYMDTTEVTQEFYDSIMSDATYGYSNYTKPSWNDSIGKGDNYPAYNVNWFDAVLFCNARSKAAGFDTVYTYTRLSGTPGNGCDSLAGISIDYSVVGFRLPTEDEWELAYRAGTTTDCYWGKDFNPYPITDADSLEINANAVWFGNSYTLASSNLDYGTYEVASKLPNANGLYDMSGNLWEWCGDWLNFNRDTSRIDYTETTIGKYRVVRGGSWIEYAYALQASERDYSLPYWVDHNFGFRCVLGGF